MTVISQNKKINEWKKTYQVEHEVNSAADGRHVVSVMSGGSEDEESHCSVSHVL